jgi:hypothetical protein
MTQVVALNSDADHILENCTYCTIYNEDHTIPIRVTISGADHFFVKVVTPEVFAELSSAGGLCGENLQGLKKKILERNGVSPAEEDTVIVLAPFTSFGSKESNFEDIFVNRGLAISRIQGDRLIRVQETDEGTHIRVHLQEAKFNVNTKEYVI